MKLLRIGAAGAEKPAILDANGKPRDLSSVVADIAGDALTPQGLARIRDTDLSTLPVLEDARIGPCVGQDLSEETWLKRAGRASSVVG